MGTIFWGFFVIFSPCLKTIIAPFLPTRLTSPGSPRMEWATNRKRKQKKNWLKYILQLWSSRELYAVKWQRYISLSLSLFAAFWKRVSLNHQYNFFFLMESVNAGRLNLLPLKPAYLRIIFWKKTSTLIRLKKIATNAGCCIKASWKKSNLLLWSRKWIKLS